MRIAAEEVVIEPLDLREAASNGDRREVDGDSGEGKLLLDVRWWGFKGECSLKVVSGELMMSALWTTRVLLCATSPKLQMELQE